MRLSRLLDVTPRIGAKATGLALGALLLTLSCGREVTGPDAVRLSRVLAIQPEFQGAPGQASVTSGVEFARVRLTLERLSGGIALDRTIDFPADADSVPLALTVELSAGSPAAGEQMSVRLRFITAAGDTVFRSGPDTLLVQPAQPGAPPTSVVVRPVYVGPGAQAARVELFPSTTSAQGGSPLAFTAQAFDGQGALVSDAPILFTSTDTAFVRFTNARVGAATTGLRQGSVTVIASLLTGPADSAAVTLTLPAAAIAAAGGNGQNGPAGSTLPAPVSVRVTAIDASPVAGVTIAFLANNGGSVAAAAVVTDANGIANTTWTLGPAAGAQTLSATAAGLTGSPVTFTATAASSGATQLAFTAAPTAGVAGSALSTITVEARDAQGNVATAFTGAVTIALGANPGSATLLGTLSTNAVAGVASFSGISLERAAAGYTLVATSAGLATATSAAFGISGGTATTLVFGTQPASAMVGVALAPAVQVVARDAFGNTAPGFTGAVTVALGSNPGSATLGGTLSVNAVAGIATFSTLSVNVTGVGYTLVASAVGLTGATSLPFNTSAAVLSWVNASGGNWSVPANWSLGRVPTEIDSVVIDLAGTYTVNLDTTFTGTFIAVGGSSGAQTLALTSRTLTIAGQLTTQGTGALALTSATVTGGGTIINAGALSLRNGTVAAALVNSGTVTANATNPITGTLTTVAGSTLRVRSDGTTGFASLVVASGFTNLGAIELTTADGAYSTYLEVTNGTLVNAPSGTLTSVVGAGGSRALAAAVDNQGVMAVAHPLSWQRAGSVHTNSGTIDVSGGDLALNQSGTGPSFTNTGSIAIAAGRAFAVTGGTLNQSAGSVSGPGTLSLTNATANLTTNLSNAALELAFSGATVNGPGTLTNSAGRTLSLRNTTIAAPFVNQGTVIANATNGITGALTTVTGSTLRARSDGTTGFASIVVANGFTNLGAIDLTTADGAYSAYFEVTNGTLLNATGATITSAVGAGGSRTLAAAIDNQGVMTIAHPLAWQRAGSVHANSGTIDLSGGDLSLNQTGTNPSFTNTGTVSIAAGRTLAVTNGTFTQSAGTIGGTGTLSFTNATATFTTDFSNAALTLALNGTTVNGPGTLTNATGRTLSIRNTTIAAPFINEGTVVANATNAIPATLTTVAGSTLRVRSDGTTGFASIVVANGFTNLGAIELTTADGAYSAYFEVTNGTLLNASGGTITSAVGAGGSRTLAAAVDNQGVMTLAHPLAWQRASSSHSNSGTIDLSGGDLSLNQTGTNPSFTNTGTVSIAAGRTLAVTNGTFTQSAGSIGGTGTLSFTNAAATFTTDFSNAALTLALNGTTVNGPGTLTNATGRTLTIRNTTIATPFINEGTVIANATNGITGALTTVAGSTLRVRSDGTTGFANLIVANGFTNVGAIELTTADGAYSSLFEVTNGTLINAVGATITSAVGAGGSRTLAAAVDNQGVMTLAHPLTWQRAGAVNANSGTLDVSGGNLTLTQSGAGASFTNTGTVTIATGRAFTVTGGAFAQDGGSFGGTGDLVLVNAIVTGPGTLVNPAGRTLSLRGTTIAAPFLNEGTLAVFTSSTISGALTTAAGSAIRISSDGAVGLVDLVVANGFTNLGAIDLTSTVSTYTAQITVQNGTLLNAPGGTISALTGTGGPRILVAAVDNQGLISIAQPLTWQRASSVHTNSGTIDIAGGSLTLDLNGGASFTNAGAVTIGTGRTLSATGGTFAQDGGTIGGPGDLLLTNTTVNGPGTFTNPAGRTVAIRNTTIAAPFVNDGTLSVITSSTISGPFTTGPGSTIRIASDGAVGLVDLVVTNGFTNLGAIDLTSTVSTYTARLTVQTGSLINATIGTINALTGTGGPRILAAEVDNQGLIDIAQTLTLQRAGSAHTNSGTLDLNGGDLVLDLAGGASFTNAGSVVIGAGRTLSASGGSFAQNGGTFGGTGDLVLTNVTVDGPGTFINAAGRTVVIRNTTIAAPFVNQGTLSVITSSAITGTLSTAVGSTIRIASDGAVGLVDLTVSNGFTNLGAIDLTSTVSTYTSQLTVTNGTLLNGAAGAINALAGTGGPRNIFAAIDNQGTIALSPGSAGTLNVTGNVTSSGTIALDLGGLAAGSQYDRIAVTGTLSLGGTLNVGLFGGFVPASTNAFTVLTSTGATSGTFATANLAAPLAATPTYAANAVTVAVP